MAASCAGLHACRSYFKLASGCRGVPESHSIAWWWGGEKNVSCVVALLAQHLDESGDALTFYLL